MFTVYTSSSKKLFYSSKLMQRTFGKVNSEKILSRMSEIEKAPTLRSLLSGRPHLLHGRREGYIALDIQHPYRLICKPIEYTTNILDARALQICEVVDYH